MKTFILDRKVRETCYSRLKSLFESVLKPTLSSLLSGRQLNERCGFDDFNLNLKFLTLSTKSSSHIFSFK